MFSEACTHKISSIPKSVATMEVKDVRQDLDCGLVFSALPSSIAGKVEEELARRGLVVASNASYHRMDVDVPLVIPEVNPGHLRLVKVQKRNRKTEGFIVTNPNCTATQLVLALKPLHDAFTLEKVNVVSMQALSGAGYPGVASMDIVDNVIPFIKGEEEKVEEEPL
jgi:aspartate-semialdehyde dehydrogenase